MPPRVGATSRHHPLCPRCNFDLVATIDANRRVCPECGNQFTLDDLERRRRPEEWTEWIGLRRALLSLLGRALLVAPVWTGIVWLVTPVLEFLRNVPAVELMFIVGLPLVIAGYAIGALLCRQMSDIAGMNGVVLLGLCVAVIVAVCWGSVELAGLIRPLDGWPRQFIVFGPGVGALLWALRETMLD